MQLTAEQQTRFLEACQKYSESMRARQAEAKKTIHQVHGYMVYKCRQCGGIYIMWLEKGLEDPLAEKIFNMKHKPVPFAITCIQCFNSCQHVHWDIGNSTEYTEKPDDANFFMLTEEDDCGLPVIFKKDYDRESEFFKDKNIPRRKMARAPWENSSAVEGIFEFGSGKIPGLEFPQNNAMPGRPKSGFEQMLDQLKKKGEN